MKGIILAGGSGSRLHPLTRVTSKQLLPVYNQPMIYFPLNTLLKAGIRDILIIVAPDHAGDYVNLLGSGKQFGARFSFEVQDKPEGLSQAFLIGEDFVGNDSVAMILGDNLFTHDFGPSVRSFQGGGLVFAKEIHDPERFGVIEFDPRGQVLSIEEKPAHPKSNFAQVGLYVFDSRAAAFAKTLKPSARGELEIVDLARKYLELGELRCEKLEGEWIDAGTIESLHKASCLVREKELGFKPEELRIQLEIRNVKTKARL